MQLGLIRAILLWNTGRGYLSIFNNETGYYKTYGKSSYASSMHAGSIAACRVPMSEGQESFKTKTLSLSLKTCPHWVRPFKKHSVRRFSSHSDSQLPLKATAINWKNNLAHHSQSSGWELRVTPSKATSQLCWIIKAGCWSWCKSYKVPPCTEYVF